MFQQKIDASGCDRPVLRDIVNHVIPSVATRWYDLGLQLLDPTYENELNIIEADKDDAKTCCRKMFSKWLNTDKLASWDKVIEALEKIEQNNVARNIKQKLRQGKGSKKKAQAKATGNQLENSTNGADKRRQGDSGTTQSAHMAKEELKKVLKEQGLKTSGNKAELQERLKEVTNLQRSSYRTDIGGLPRVKKPKTDSDMGLRKKAKINPSVETSTKGTDALRQKRRQEDTIDTGATRSSSVKETAKLTVEELKKELKGQGLKTSGNKPELQERLKEATSSKSSSNKTDTGGPQKSKTYSDMGTAMKALVKPACVTSAKSTDTLGQTRKKEDITDASGTRSSLVKDAAKTTVKELKEELKEQGLKTSGKKVELQERLKEATSLNNSSNDNETGGPPSVKKPKTDTDMGSKRKALVNEAGETSTKGTNTQGRKRKQEDTTHTDATPGTLVKDTVEELKKALKEQGLKTSGKKAELQERLKEAASLKGSLHRTDIGGPPCVKKPKTDSSIYVSVIKTDTGGPPCAKKLKTDSGSAYTTNEQGKGKMTTTDSKVTRDISGKAVPVSKRKKKYSHKVDERVINADWYEAVDDWNCLLLKQSNDGQSKDNYYKMQMLNLKSNTSSYYVWSWWGHEGEKGQSNTLSFSSLEDAEKEFKRKFLEKTKSNWENRSNFVPVPGKHTLLEMNTTKDKNTTGVKKYEVAKIIK